MDDTVQTARVLSCQGHEHFLAGEGRRAVIMRSPNRTGSCPEFWADVNGLGFRKAVGCG